MKPYELTYIISSQIPSEQSENVKKEVETFIQEKGGVILKSTKSVPQGLAYTIKKQSSGYFGILEFDSEEKNIKDIKAQLEKDTNILRHFIIFKKPAKKMKERRMRKPMPAVEGESMIKSVGEKTKKKDVKVELEDVEKKLDEILS